MGFNSLSGSVIVLLSYGKQPVPWKHWLVIIYRNKY